MPSRTSIVCLHEGQKGRSIDPVFINTLLKALDPAWIRPWDGGNVIRLVPCGGRSELITLFPKELNACRTVGSNTTLMVWADLDDDLVSGEALSKLLWQEASRYGLDTETLHDVVFVFAKDRLENWIEFLLTGKTNEAVEGKRINLKQSADAARKLARRCQGEKGPDLPPSLQWSCNNWRDLVERMR